MPFCNAFIGQAVQFVGRASFFFGGALFSAIFFRHLPELDVFTAVEEALIRGFLIMGVLFALFCYSLELDQLGRALDGPLRGSLTDR